MHTNPALPLGTGALDELSVPLPSGAQHPPRTCHVGPRVIAWGPREGKGPHGPMPCGTPPHKGCCRTSTRRTAPAHPRDENAGESSPLSHRRARCRARVDIESPTPGPKPDVARRAQVPTVRRPAGPNMAPLPAPSPHSYEDTTR